MYLLNFLTFSPLLIILLTVVIIKEYIKKCGTGVKSYIYSPSYIYFYSK